MGGGTFGNRSAVAEFNIWADPEAAAIVFGYGGPLVMAGLDVTHQFLATPDRIAAVRRRPGRLAATLADLLDVLLRRRTSPATTTSPARRSTIRSPCSPSPTRTCSSAERRHVAVETAGTLTRGMTVIDRRTLKERPPPELRRAHLGRRRRRLDRHHRRPSAAAVEYVAMRLADTTYSGCTTHSTAPTVRSAMSEHDDSFPRQSARTQRFTLGEPRDVVVSPDGQRIVFLRSRGGTDPVNCLWVVDAATGDERLVADPGRAARRPRRRAAARGAGPARAGPGDRRRDHRLRHRRRRHRRRLRPRRAAVRRRAAQRPGPRAPRRRPGVRPPARPARPASRLRQRPAAVPRRARRALARARRRRRRRAGDGHVGQRRLHRRRGDGPLARLLVEPRTARRSPSAGSTPRPCSGGTSPTPPTRPQRHASCRTRPPGHRTPTSRCTSSASTATIVDVEWDRDAFPYLADVHWTEAGLIASVQSRDQRALDVVRVDPATGATERAVRGPRRRVGRARPGRAPAHRDGLARHVCRPRRRPPPARRRRGR